MDRIGKPVVKKCYMFQFLLYTGRLPNEVSRRIFESNIFIFRDVFKEGK